MAPKRNAAAVPKISQTTAERPITTVPQATVATKISKKNNQSLNAGEVLNSIWQKYVDETPQRTKLIDVFMAFLVVVGVLQFVYCVIVGNYVCGGAACIAQGVGIRMVANEMIAIQCFLVGILGDGWTVCSYGIVAHSNERGEQGGVWDYFTRKVRSWSYDCGRGHKLTAAQSICGLRLRLPHPTLLLRQLHQLASRYHTSAIPTDEKMY